MLADLEKAKSYLLAYLDLARVEPESASCEAMCLLAAGGLQRFYPDSVKLTSWVSNLIGRKQEKEASRSPHRFGYLVGYRC